MSSENARSRLEKQMKLKPVEGGDAIYREGRFLARVRIGKVSLDEQKITAQISLIADLTEEGETAGLANTWDISAVWSAFSMSEEYWSCPLVSWSIYFNPALIAAVKRFSTSAQAVELSAADKRTKIVSLLREFA